MGSKRKKYPLYEQVRILDIGAEGKSVARKDNLVIFVSNAVPGDVVDLQVTRKRKNYQEGYAVTFYEKSPKRETPFCEHFGICGGCKWQDLNYTEQLYYKQKQVTDQMERIAGIGPEKAPAVYPIIPSRQTKYYRNKLEFSFSNKRWLTAEELSKNIIYAKRNALGFHIHGMFDKILDINTCYLQPDPSNIIRKTIRKFALDHNLEFFDLKEQTGLLRNLIIRTTTTGEAMVILSFFCDHDEMRKALLDHVREKFPGITSLMYVINSKPNDTITDLDVILHSGRDHIVEKLEDLQFRIGPKSFFQTNSEQAARLYDVVRSLAALSRNEIVYDLYTGTGTIANFIARECKKVIGVEQIPEAIQYAETNSRINGIDNTRFIEGDIKDILSEQFLAENGNPDVMILDPPRAGVHKKVIHSILESEPDRIVYVSCNPATQARDIKLLLEKFDVLKIQPLDMFPHTYHVENIVLLQKTTHKPS
ncbi:MAG: 23S rRNA (uracil(1939)-C(5))-methyltransferase RlmD [Bacteroidales bacterium]|nr:MAG: 23S rRNA (uracil(1939)-C(5))-methyltransferase RlmD [Bacteroidales bacterium]